MIKATALPLAALLVVAGCGPRDDNATVANVAANAANAVDMTAIPEDSDAVALDNGGANVASAAATTTTDGWIGRWNGPEGLFLEIKAADKPGIYRLTLKDTLDRQADYIGTAADDKIRFSRAGKTETIRAGSGKEAGYKWLAGKKDCLIILVSKEGYCR